MSQSQSQILLYVGIAVPALLYIASITQVVVTLYRQKPQQQTDLIWARNIDVERRRAMVAARSGPLLAYKYLILSNNDV